VIEIKELTVQTKGFSLRDISLTVQTGTCHIVIGSTGCGKTTLLEAILGLRELQRGKVMVNGRDITALPPHKRGFSYVPQDLAIFPHLTVEENITYGIRYGGIQNKKELYKLASRLAESLSITHLLKKNVRNLSGGEKQRVALARALASGCKYLLLDEPFSSLHEGMKRDLWFLLKELQKEYELTILMVSHDMDETFFLADYVSVMVDGVIHQTDNRDRVYRYPSDIEVARYFGIKNIFSGEVIDINDNNYILYSEYLKTKISLPMSATSHKYNIGDKVTFGIRQEDVMIMRPELIKKGDNLLSGLITAIYPKGSSLLAIFVPYNSGSNIEIDMPEYAVTKLNLKVSMPVTVSLRSERLFVLR